MGGRIYLEAFSDAVEVRKYTSIDLEVVGRCLEEFRDKPGKHPQSRDHPPGPLALVGFGWFGRFFLFLW